MNKPIISADSHITEPPSTTKASPSFVRVASPIWIRPASPWDSMRAAMFTASPHRS